MTVDSLQRVFKILTDTTRIRILALVEREELAVQDLVRILEIGQSSVSRHLAILKEVGLIRDRREGTYSYYRFVTPQDPDWRGAWSLAHRAVAEDPLFTRDLGALEGVLREREIRSRTWFDSIGPEWDAMREVFDDDAQRARAIAKLVPPDLTVVDVGTGTGVLAEDLARCGTRVIAVDHSKRMLAAASAKLEAAGASFGSGGSIEFRHGEATALPIADTEADAALAHMVLHYVASPPEAIREMARVVRLGGCVVIIDFVENDREWLKDELGVLWQGFPLDSVREWLSAAGLDRIEIEPHSASGSTSPKGGTRSKRNDLPATFIASAHKLRCSDS